MEFVRRTTIRGSAKEEPIKIVLLDRKIARVWHNKIRPHIKDASKVRHRLDVKWHWPALLQLAPRTEYLAGRRCFGYAVLARGTGGAAIPVGISLVVEQYKLLEGANPSSFLWLAATAPSQAFKALGVPRLDQLGEILVDTTMVTSFNAGLRGRMGLHADPRGGPHLLKFYAQDCGLDRIGSAIQLKGTRTNDGRYFFAGGGTARQAVIRRDPFRV